jgi:hypothetical protein
VRASSPPRRSSAPRRSQPLASSFLHTHKKQKTIFFDEKKKKDFFQCSSTHREALVLHSVAANGKQFSGERFNLTNEHRRSRSGYVNRAIDISLQKRNDQNKLVVSVKKSAAAHAHKVANGASTVVLRADLKANSRQINKSVINLVRNARRHSLVLAAAGRVSRLRLTQKPQQKPRIKKQRISFARRLKLAFFARKTQKKRAAKKARRDAKAVAKK